MKLLMEVNNMVVLTIMSISFGAMAFSAIVGCVTSTPP